MWKQIPERRANSDEALSPLDQLRLLLIRLSEHWESYRTFAWQNGVLWTINALSNWYRTFLEGLLSGGHQTWFAPLVAVGETAVGLALIVGAFVGVAAFLGAFMNMNFMLAGSASSNPLLFTLAVLLVLAWKVAGYYGLDRYLLPKLGAPWAPGPLFRRTA